MIQTYRNWPAWYADLMGVVRSARMFYVLRNGIRFVVRPNSLDRATIDQMWIERDYLPDRNWIRPDDVIIDAGAYIGTFSTLAARLASRGTVLAFEPQPENYRLLCANVEVNGFENVIPCRLALAAAPGPRLLRGSGTTGSLYENWPERLGGFVPSPNEYLVQCITLPEIFAQHRLERVRFLKCDCEGAEFEVFLNTPTDVLARIDRIAMEYHLVNDECRIDSLVGWLTAADFAVEVLNRGIAGMIHARRRDS